MPLRYPTVGVWFWIFLHLLGDKSFWKRQQTLTPALLQTSLPPSAWKVRVTFHFASPSPAVVHIFGLNFLWKSRKVALWCSVCTKSLKASQNSPPDSFTAAQTEQSCLIFYWLESLMWFLVWSCLDRSSCAAVCCNILTFSTNFPWFKDIHMLYKSLGMLLLNWWCHTSHTNSDVTADSP